MGISKDISELQEAGVISGETASRIRNFYEQKAGQSNSRLFLVFGVLGGLLVGSGIILILGHNWDELSMAVKTSLAFLPMLCGQILCGYALYQKADSAAWREGTAVFLFFAIGSSIALVGQIYNLPGELSSFLISWLWLGLPLVYLMGSSAVSLISWATVTHYAAEVGYWSNASAVPYLYWLMALALLPHYYRLYKKYPNGNLVGIHHWAVALSLVGALGAGRYAFPELSFIAYLSLFGCFIAIGQSTHFSHNNLRRNPYWVIGSFGSLLLLVVLSFGWFWEELSGTQEKWMLHDVLISVNFWRAALTTVLAATATYLHLRGKKLSTIDPFQWVYILFVGIFILGISSQVAPVLINLLLLAVSLQIIWQASQRSQLGRLNYGMLVVTVLIACRFFDINISFVAKGVLFVLLGIGFLATNYYLFRKWKS